MTTPHPYLASVFCLSLLVLIIGGAPIVGGQAAAQSHTASPPRSTSQTTVEYCVRCVSPPATSVCRVIVASDLVSVSEWQAFCAAQVAYDGRYGQCSATLGVQACQAEQVFSYRSTPGQGIVADGAPGQPGPRQGGFFEGAADYVRRAGANAGQTLGDGVSVVGQGVRDGAEVVSETAGEVGRGVARGARRVGDSVTRGARRVGEGVSRGVGCVFTLGRNC